MIMNFSPVIGLTTITAIPSTVSQTITIPGGYDGFITAYIAGVTAGIDLDIKATNIKSGVNILGVYGSYIANNICLLCETCDNCQSCDSCDNCDTCQSCNYCELCDSCDSYYEPTCGQVTN